MASERFRPTSKPVGLPRAPLPEYRIHLDSRAVSYHIHPSRRARLISLLIRPDTGLVVTVPARWGHPSTPLRLAQGRSGCRPDDARVHLMPEGLQGHAERFIRRHQRWVLRYLKRFDALAARLPKRWPYGTTLPYRGIEHAVHVEAGRGRGTVERGEGTLFVWMRQPGLEGARRLLKRWYVAEAHQWLRQRTTVLGAQLDIRWQHLTVRNQRRRWGSCSPAGRLSFNYRLVMAPPAVLDYVVIHELVHCREPNHSTRFWALVEKSCPGYRQARAWLRTDGAYLGI